MTFLGGALSRKPKRKKPKAKPHGRKITFETIWSEPPWRVRVGELRRRQGRPRAIEPLFAAVAEKIPFDALEDVRDQLADEGIAATGIYMAHDSMGVVRYIGRGSIFARLRTRKRAQQLELIYFSFYVVADKTHERELETLLIRAVSPMLHFNNKKKRVDIQPGNVRDYEAGTLFFERQYTRGARAKSSGKRKVRR